MNPTKKALGGNMLSILYPGRILRLLIAYELHGSSLLNAKSRRLVLQPWVKSSPQLLQSSCVLLLESDHIPHYFQKTTMGSTVTVQAAWLVITIVIINVLYRCLYRIYLSPLAAIPGPKTAALTGAYEQYYDLIEKARFPWKIEQLHKKYGPIVRIRPNEVHINDPAYGETHFSSSPTLQLNKYAPHQNQFGMPQSTFNTVDAELHKLRRGVVAPFFSRRSILALETMLQEKVERVCIRLTEAQRSGQPIDLRLLFSCMTTDIITEYAFPNCFDLLSTPDLSPAWRNTFSQGLRNFHWFKHYPFLWRVLRSIPDKLLLRLSPEMKITQDWERGNQKLVRDIINSHDPNQKPSERHPTIFHEILSSDLPSEEKSYERLWQEGASLIGAGVETTSNTLNVILFHLLQNKTQLDRLQIELQSAMHDPSHLASWSELEKLPYLTAVINEGLRKAMGTTSRFIRVAPHHDLQYKNYTIPAGTAVSMSVMPLHNNAQVFHEPHAFVPERWLGENVKSDLFVFGKGPRMCSGQNLAYAELYLALAAVLRRFRLELFETTVTDVEAVCDAFMPMPREDSKGVRVLVRGN
ncbi:hypothetical protein GJ744_008046 [Endocarpon pusillum]|uniref:Cytochrome P450 n=1 Tax=Endocarpon pusillum TaxID=364733 RepID=A0A8H7AI44_9EURO|nr:hypothetical protein GJ744_008046 [Endocarpon pusillum]